MKLSKITFLSSAIIAGMFAPSTANAQGIPLHRQQKAPATYSGQQNPNAKVQGQLQISPAQQQPTYQRGYVPQQTVTNAQTAQVITSPIQTAQPNMNMQPQYVQQATPVSQEILAMQGVRIAQLEDIIRGLTGQIEQLNHKIAQQSQQLAIMAKDVNYRFSAIEQKSFGAPNNQPIVMQQPQPLGTPVAQQTTLKKTLPPTGVKQPAIVAAGFSPWAQASTPNTGNIVQQTISAPQQAPAVIKPTDRSIYNEAYSLLRQGKYGDAEKKLKAMLKQFPNSNLAGNAQYWLGETYYARKQFEQAAVAFADGYKKYSTSTKGPDNLLKLGLSMKALGKTADACVAFKAMTATFPDAPNAIKQRAKSEVASSKCE